MYNEIRGINYKKLLCKMLKGWKIFVLLGIIMSILLGSYKYISDVRSHKSLNKNKGKLTIEQIEELNTIIDEYNMLNYYETYFENSYLTKLNTNNYDVLSIRYFVDTDYTISLNGEIESDYTSAIVSAYANYLSSNDFASSVKKDLNVSKDAEYIRELISVSSNSDTKVVSIDIIIPKEFVDYDVESIVDEYVNKYSTNIKSIGSHSIIKIGSEAFTTYSESILKRNYNLNKTIEKTRQNIEDLKIELDTYQKMYLSEELTQEEYRSEYKVSTNTKINIKYILVGFLVGVIGVFAVYACRMIFSSKLQDEEDIENLFGVLTLGKVNVKEDKKNLYTHRIINKGMEIKTREEQLDYLVDVLSYMCNNKAIKDISFISSNLTDSDKKTLIELCGQLNKININTYISYNLIQNKEELEQILIMNNTIIVGSIEETYYHIIDKQIKVLKLHNSNILGTIIFE